jgi:hypothetical protein
MTTRNPQHEYRNPNIEIRNSECIMPQFSREYEPERRQPSGTSGLAIASVVLSALGFCLLPIIGGVVGAVLGIISLGQITSSNGRTGGTGLAITAIVLGALNLILLGPIMLMLGLAMPAVSKVRTAANRMNSANNLKQIGIAMHIIHSERNELPAASIKDKNGKALLSWRVAILPHIEHDHLYQQFHLDEPWDSPHNLTLLPLMPKVYLLPGEENASAGMTHYRVFVGPGTMFDDSLNRPIKFPDVTDGLSNTLMVVQARDAVPWTKPDELTFNPADPTLPELGDVQTGGFNVLLGDGSVVFMKLPADQPTLRLLIQRADNQAVDLENMKK